VIKSHVLYRLSYGLERFDRGHPYVAFAGFAQATRRQAIQDRQLARRFFAPALLDCRSIPTPSENGKHANADRQPRRRPA
jgi:hypothetical protein